MMKKHNDLCIGIDLGTTNSVVATVREQGNGEIKTPLVKIERYTDISNSNGRQIREKSELLPSVVYYPDNDEPIVGDVGKKQRLSQPYAVVSSVKSQMGERTLKESSANIIDKTPEEVASRILKHMLYEVKKQFGEDEITDVVITVPANFAFEKRQATMKAAELAGIEVSKNSDGLYNDEELLLSEPEAVVFDFINQMKNGTINVRMDFTTPKKMLVFDIGGGTLDITLHEVVENEKDKYTISAIATNRFSNVAGDKFDEKLVDEIFERYYRTYNSSSKDAGTQIKRNSDKLKKEIKHYAELLKIDISDRYDDFAARNKKISPDHEFDDCSGLLSNNYTLDEPFTIVDFEECLDSLMGNQYSYDDYINFENISDSENIIYPILDVLYKAYKKTGSAIKIDGVILNGGMSRLYLIKERLERFFGFKPIMVTDPDKSVAQGAAVYHYYQHKKNSIMNKLGFDDYATANYNNLDEIKKIGIHSTGSILPESIYLGLKGGTSYELIPAGQVLPFSPDTINGFGIVTGQKETLIPIMRKTKSGYETIASGRIFFKNTYKNDTNVSVKFSLNRNQLLTFEAWTSTDNSGLDVIEKGIVELNLGNSTMDRKKLSKMSPPSGTIVPVKNALGQLKNLCCNDLKIAYRKKNQKQQSNISKKIREQKSLIIECGNPAEFATAIIKDIENETNPTYVNALLPIARKLSLYWSEQDKYKLAVACENILLKNKYRIGIDFGNNDVSVNIEAIQALGIVGDKEQLKSLELFETSPKYKSSLLYAYGCAGIKTDWILNQFYYNYNNNKSIQDSMKAIGFSIRNGAYITEDIREDIIVHLLNIINGSYINKNELVIALMALGYCCSIEYRQELINNANKACENIICNYSPDIANYSSHARAIANCLINKKEISDADEVYLLSLFES